jgi:hypothetical protein
VAILSITPHVSDMVTLKECSALFRRTGHPFSVTTLRTWITKWGIPTERQGRTDRVSYTRMLQVHKEEVARRDGV